MKRAFHYILVVIAALVVAAIIAGTILKIQYDAVTPCAVLRAQLIEATADEKPPGAILTRVLIDHVTARASTAECAQRVWLIWTK